MFRRAGSDARVATASAACARAGSDASRIALYLAPSHASPRPHPHQGPYRTVSVHLAEHVQEQMQKGVGMCKERGQPWRIMDNGVPK